MSYLRQFHLAAVLGASLFATAAAAQDLPGGASSLRENHGDWVVVCAVQSQGGRNVKQCALAQEQTESKSNQRVLTVELKPEHTGATGFLLLPLGLALDQGAALQIDDGAAGAPQKFRTCIPAGCLVPLTFDARMLAALRKAAQIKIKTVADGGKELPFAISLKGFPGALDRTIALMK